MLKSMASAWAIFMSCIPDCSTAAAPPSLILILMRCKRCRHSGRHIVRCAASLPAASIFPLSRRSYAGCDLENKLRQLAGDSLVSLQFLLIFPLPPDKKSVSFRLTLGSDDRTLTAEEVTRTREKVVEGVKAAGYELRE